MVVAQLRGAEFKKGRAGYVPTAPCGSYGIATDAMMDVVMAFGCRDEWHYLDALNRHGEKMKEKLKLRRKESVKN